MSLRLAVLPAAPLLLPRTSQELPGGCAEVLAACDEVLAPLLAGVDEVVIVAAPDHLRDLTGPEVSGGSPIGAQVAESMLDRVGFEGVRIHETGTAHDRDCEVWLLMADGSASVGDKSPRPGDQGQTFDAALSQSLARGDFAGLAAITDTQAMAVGCTTARVWRRLADLAADGAHCQALAEFAPFGVRYFVGSWTAEAGTR